MPDNRGPDNRGSTVHVGYIYIIIAVVMETQDLCAHVMTSITSSTSQMLRRRERPGVDPLYTDGHAMHCFQHSGKPIIINLLLVIAE